MCGIFGIINPKYDTKVITSSFDKGYKRGPEFSVLNKYDNIYFGFHRLAINGLNSKSNQPFEIDNIILICNGEIYNYKKLAENNNISLKTESDCEIILHMYKLYGIEYTLSVLDGVFAFMLYDKNKNKVIISRDPYGVRPLYIHYNNETILISSELKCIYNLCINKKEIFNFTPGHYIYINNHKNYLMYYNRKYTYFPFVQNKFELNNIFYNSLCGFLKKAVKKRVIGTTERPIGCLLSGGLDSSLIACLVNKYLKQQDPSKKLETFSIGLDGSEDLKYAKIVANHINSNHHEIIVSEDDFFNAIPEVIENISSYDTTTVRASVGNYLIGKYIKENTDCKVIFNGDGADELMGGYLYMKSCPNPYEFDKETKRLLNDIHMFDVLRSDRCISSHGLEPRTPFLDREFVEFYLSIDKNIRYFTTLNKCEKYLIRQSFSTIYKDLVPESILWRTKEAFSDGVSSLNRSWYEIIDEKIKSLMLYDENINKELNNIRITYNNFDLSPNIPCTDEQLYYRYLFNQKYSMTDNLIPYFWMPKYVSSNDASARTLNIYKNNNSNCNNVKEDILDLV